MKFYLHMKEPRSLEWMRGRFSALNQVNREQTLDNWLARFPECDSSGNAVKPKEEPEVITKAQRRLNGDNPNADYAIGRDVRVWDRYLFAVPLIATVSDYSNKNSGIEVILRESNNKMYPVGSKVWVSWHQCELLDDALTKPPSPTPDLVEELAKIANCAYTLRMQALGENFHTWNKWEDMPINVRLSEIAAADAVLTALHAKGWMSLTDAAEYCEHTVTEILANETITKPHRFTDEELYNFCAQLLEKVAQMQVLPVGAVLEHFGLHK